MYLWHVKTNSLNITSSPKLTHRIFTFIERIILLNTFQDKIGNENQLLNAYSNFIKVKFTSGLQII